MRYQGQNFESARSRVHKYQERRDDIPPAENPRADIQDPIASSLSPAGPRVEDDDTEDTEDLEEKLKTVG